MLRRSANILAGALIGLLAGGILFLLTSKPRGAPILLKPPPTQPPLRIHVTGAVREAGVYELSPGSIVNDAIETAGGALPEADLSAINLAAPLIDGQQVIVPERNDPGPRAGGTSGPVGADPFGAVHVNSADIVELQQLPGIGPVLAQKIIEYREAHGPFARPEDLLNVSGIGPSTLEAIRDRIRVP